jgi:hypothetical protein
MPTGDAPSNVNLHSEDPHSEFRSLIMLFTLATAINNRGRPILHDCSEPYKEPLERSLPTRNKMQNAVSILLSRNAQAVAVAASDPSAQQHFYHLWAIPQGQWQLKYSAIQKNHILVDFGRSHFATVDFHKWDSLFTIS